MPDASIITRQTASEMVRSYQQAKEMIEKAYTDLGKAEAILHQSFGGAYFDVLPAHSYNSIKDLPEVMAKIRQKAWRCIIDRIEIRKTLSVKRAEEMDKKLEDLKAIPEITEPAVFDMVQTLVRQSGDFAREAVMEVFEYLRPAAHKNSWSRNYKTNQKNGKYSIGKKVILSDIVEFGVGCRLRVSYSSICQNNLCAIDKVFYLLDGAGTPPGYRGELIDAINTAPDGVGETKYFRFRACQNGNLHLEFKRLDLVNHLNAIAGNPTQLRGE